MASPNLNITHVAASQNQKEVTINDAIDKLDLAVTDTATYDMASGNATVTAAEFRENVYFAPQATLTAPRTLTIPTAIKRLFVASNGNAAAANTLTVACGATSVVIPGGERRLLYTDGTTVREIGGGGALATLADVLIANVQDGDALIYDLALGKWKNGAGGGGGNVVSNYTAPFKGALLARSTNYTHAGGSTFAAIPFDQETYDTGGFHDAITNNTRITIPTGVTKVRMLGGSTITPTVSGSYQALHIRKNGGGAYVGPVRVLDYESSSQEKGLEIITPVIAVSAGDYFELVWYSNDGGPLQADRTFFAVEVVETSEAVAQPCDVSGFHNGVAGTSQVILRHAFARAATFPSGLADSTGTAGTAATASATYAITKNGTEVGTMVFAAGATTATFTMAGSTSFAAGDVLAVIAPATPDGTLADIAFTLAGTRA